jgi:DNA-binding NtrC family response regulator
MAEHRILIVDDEPAMRLALREVLRQRWEVREVTDGKEALRHLGEGDVSLVITDVRMPEMTGPDLLKEIQRLPSAPPVIVMTAFGTVDDAVDAMKAGAVDYLLKPFSAEVVLEAVERALGRVAAEKRLTRETKRPAAQPGAVRSLNGKMANPFPVIADDPSMRDVIQFVDAIADSEATILLTGESGVGKEVVARHIHHRSGRRDGPFIAVNCAALPDTLLESELFGYEKGAFTGAVQARPGKFELANGGTILLDEISEMPKALQAKLLRVLQEHVIDPIGARRPTEIDIRVIATSNRDMGQSVAEGEFRQDLFYRLNVIGVEIPPLRQRPRDVAPLARFFARKHAMRNRREVPAVGDDVVQHLQAQPWPGNVRELENFIERAVLLTRGKEMRMEDLHLGALSPVLRFEPVIPGQSTLAEMERQMIVQTLQETGGNRTRAAEILGVSVRTVRNKINEYGLKQAV